MQTESFTKLFGTKGTRDAHVKPKTLSEGQNPISAASNTPGRNHMKKEDLIPNEACYIKTNGQQSIPKGVPGVEESVSCSWGPAFECMSSPPGMSSFKICSGPELHAVFEDTNDQDNVKGNKTACLKFFASLII
ncbi:hypothetical protein DV515_00015973 [Chloebia gouldiae]|uniref:Uncharacterized protein n=1 Tax=Chloebia gouldiae TaxID=44316 RepID=A0A3L8RV75_CHLGU|nr:hypothetical protein DV515_00015973 [Chloebia gouldiae]